MRLPPLVIALICLGCSGKDSASVPPSARPPAEKVALPFVPEGIADQLGDANVILALDVAGLELHELTAAIPEELACVREVLDSVGILVLAMGVGQPTAAFVTGVPEAAAKRCVDSFAPMFGATVAIERGVYTVAVGDTKASLTWKAGTLVIEQLGQPRKPGLPDAAKRALIARVPRDAKGWIASGAFPNHSIKESIVWIRVAPAAWHIVVDAEGTTPGAARTWTADIIEGFKGGFGKNGVVVEDSWFVLTSPTPMTAHLEASIPTDIFQRMTPP